MNSADTGLGLAILSIPPGWTPVEPAATESPHPLQNLAVSSTDIPQLSQIILLLSAEPSVFEECEDLGVCLDSNALTQIHASLA